VRFEWGISGAQAVRGACYVVVDVLSFTTAVSVAVEAGTAVYPYRWRDDSATTYAQRVGAILAVGRRAATSQVPWTLSPAALRDAPAVPALVLPSPNGSTITAALAGKPVVAACLQIGPVRELARQHPTHQRHIGADLIGVHPDLPIAPDPQRVAPAASTLSLCRAGESGSLP
jgi:hypothetical protein